MILLGAMFDLMFGSVRDAFHASEGLLELLRERLQGKRFVFLAGNHDHHFVRREAEVLLALELATGKTPVELRGELRQSDLLRRILESQLPGVEVDIRYPTYTFAGVLCTHGHYLDFHARRSGGAPGRLLARSLWWIAVGGDDQAPTVDDYEATITLLRAMLYTIAQLPNGTQAQRRAFASFKALERTVRVGTAPARGLEHARHWLIEHTDRSAPERRRLRAQREAAGYLNARSQEAARRKQTGAPTGGEAATQALVRLVNPSDSAVPAVEAIDRVVSNLGWADHTDKVVFAHTHQPLDGVRADGGSIRYWNTGSWIYEPDLSSRRVSSGCANTSTRSTA